MLAQVAKDVIQLGREKIGRNDPCPCNSGKKYKQCCLLSESVNMATPPPAPAPTLNPAQLGELAALFNTQRFSDMEMLAQSLVRQYPDSGAAWKALGTAQHVQNKDAVAALKKAIRLLPDDPETLNNLAASLLNRNVADEAALIAGKALAIRPDFAEAHANLARSLALLGRLDESISHYRAAATLRPEFALIHSGLGGALHELGNFDEAAASFQRAIALDPNMIEAHYGLAYLKTYAADDPDLATLEFQRSRANTLPMEVRLRLWFALGKAYEDAGRYDDAFVAYHEGNRLKAVPRNEAGEDRMIERIITMFSREFIEQHADCGFADKTPVFIVGMPRSGTTLLEQILATYPDSIYGAGELNDLGIVVEETFRSNPSKPFPTALADLPREVFARMGQQYVARIKRLAPEARYVIDKMPANFFYVGLIRLILPHAKIIHAMRNPMDSCFSSYARLFNSDQQEFTYDLGSLGLYYQRYARLMRHWHDVLPSGSILDVRYEDLVENTEAQARRIIDYLELPWDERCLDFHRNTRRVGSASAAQVRKPVYQTSVARWKHFEKHLAPLEQSLGEYRNY